MTNEQLAGKILELVGGKDNVLATTNCMTRLRLRLKDNAKADLETLKKTEGIMGIVDAETLQIVVGPGKAKKLMDILADEHGISKDPGVTEDWQAAKAAVKGTRK